MMQVIFVTIVVVIKYYKGVIIINSLWNLIRGTFIANSKNPASDLNSLTYTDYYYRLQTIALSLFEWKNIPDGCNERFLEKTLYMHGCALFFKDSMRGLMNARCAQNGSLNYYDEPIAYTAYGNGLSTRSVINAKDCVLVRNNIIQRPTDDTIILFASRLTENQRTIDINLNAQKTPCFIACDEKDRITIENIYKKYEGNSPVIISGKKFNNDVVTSIKTDAPYVIDKLDNHDTKIWNDIYTFFGINNANTEKKERLITDEANANNGAVSINAQTMLLTRKKACEQINVLFGTNISVELRDLSEMIGNVQHMEVGQNG